MAALTDRMALTDPSSRVIADPAKPSAVGAVVSFVSDTFDSFMQLSQDMSKNKVAAAAKAKQAAEANIAYEVTGAPQRALETTVNQNQAAQESQGVLSSLRDSMTTPADKASGVSTDASGGMFTTPPADISPGTQKEISNATNKAVSIAAAVEQGRMPHITIEAALNADFRRLREKYPQHAEYIMDMYKKSGIDSNLFTELQDAKDERNYAREAAQTKLSTEAKFQQDTIESAKVALGPDSIGMSDADLFTKGLAYRQTAFNLDNATKAAQARLTNANATEAENKSAQTELDHIVNKEISELAFVDSATYVRMGNEIQDALSKDPTNTGHMERWQALGVKVNQKAEIFTNHAVQIAISKGASTETANGLRTQLTAQFAPLKELFVGDFSQAKAAQDALKSIQTATALGVEKSLPLYSALRGAGMKVDQMPGLMAAIDNNPDLQKQLKAEALGFTQEWGQDRASTHVMNIVRLLRGETTLKNMSAGEATRAVPSLVTSTRAYATDLRMGRMKDPDLMITGVGQITLGVRTLGPSTDPALTYVATKGFADPLIRNQLIKAVTNPNVDKTELLATIQASRAGSAHLAQNITLQVAKVNKANPTFRIDWDNDNAKYTIARLRVPESDETRGMSDATYFRIMGRTRDQSNKEPIPKDVYNTVAAANMNLDNAIDLGRVDPSTPKGTDLELRRWYGRGEPLKGEKNAPIDYNKSVDKMFTNFETMLDNGIQRGTDTRGVQASQLEGQYRPIVEQAAAANGVPNNIGVALVKHESSFDPNRPGQVIKSGTHKGDRAMGLGQVMAKTAAAFGVADRSKLDAAGQADLAMKVLKKNFDASGNWQDAVSMYFTGVRYDQAVREGRSDGFQDVMTYVKAITHGG